MNIAQILLSAANIIKILGDLGTPVPVSIVNTAAKAIPIISAVQNISVSPPMNLVQTVNDFATIAATIAPIGIAAADSEIQTILGEVSKYAASIANLQAGQAVIVGSSMISINGKTEKVSLAMFIEGGAAAQSLGL
jgi:hypothetical protein